MTSTPKTETIELQTVQPGPDGFHSGPGGRRRTALLVVAAALAALALLIYSGIHSRAVAESRLSQQTQEAAVPTVAVVFPQEGAPTQEIVLPGNTQAFSDAPIYARTSGYLKRWYFDIGAHVEKGQLLAEIETPEVDQQLLQARADLDTAQANLNIAKMYLNEKLDTRKAIHYLKEVCKANVDDATEASREEAKLLLKRISLKPRHRTR